MKYNFEYYNNHPIVEIDGYNFVLDLGSPSSFSFHGKPRELEINERCFDLPINPGNRNPLEISNLVGKRIDGFIGLDVLSKMSKFYMNRNEHYIKFGECENINFEHQVLLSEQYFSSNKILMINVGINGKNVNAIFDSGACVSYVSQELLRGCRCTGIVNDYSPDFGGDISTEKYEICMNIDNIKINCEIAKMTPRLEAAIANNGYKAIIGFAEIPWTEIFIDIENGIFKFN